jgi:hypothetical protein
VISAGQVGHGSSAAQLLVALLATLELLDEDFPEIPDPLAAPVDL